MFFKSAILPTIFAFAAPTLAQQRPKILALHGGGGSGNSFPGNLGMRDLEDSLPGFEVSESSLRIAILVTRTVRSPLAKVCLRHWRLPHWR